MKIILLVLCLFIAGCEKKLEVNYVMDGYISEEIGTIELNRADIQDVLVEARLGKKNVVLFEMDVIDQIGNNNTSYYHVDSVNKEVYEGKYLSFKEKSYRIIDPYGMLMLETDEYRIFKQSTPIVAFPNTSSEYIVGNEYEYYYEKNGELTFLCGFERTNKTATMIIMEEEIFYNELEDKGYILCPDDEGVVLYEIQDENLKEITIYPYDKEGYSLTNIRIVNQKERVYYAGYEGELFVHRDEEYTFTFKEDAMFYDDHILVCEYDEMNNPIRSYIIDRQTQKKYEYNKIVDLKKLDYFSETLLVTNGQTKDVYSLNDDLSMTIVELPFGKEFEYISMDENKFITYTCEQNEEKIIYRFYLVSLVK